MYAPPLRSSDGRKPSGHIPPNSLAPGENSSSTVPWCCGRSWKAPAHWRRVTGKWEGPRPFCCSTTNAVSNCPLRVQSGRHLSAKLFRRLRQLDDDVAKFFRGNEAAFDIHLHLIVHRLSTGGAPMMPPATCTFCSRMASTTSLAVKFRAASLSGWSQMRMA